MKPVETECTAGETNNRCRQAESKLRYSSYELRFPGIHVGKYHVRINANCLFFLAEIEIDWITLQRRSEAEEMEEIGRPGHLLWMGGGSGHYVETLECKPK